MCVAAFALTACGPKSEKKAEEAGSKAVEAVEAAVDAAKEAVKEADVKDLQAAYDELVKLGDKLTDEQKEQLSKLEKMIKDAKEAVAEDIKVRKAVDFMYDSAVKK